MKVEKKISHHLRRTNRKKVERRKKGKFSNELSFFSLFPKSNEKSEKIF